ncbi:MAG: AAA family ATPase [Anaerolineae bacterium]
MRAIEATVHNFLSISHPQTLRLDRITALVGPNESGKTNLLRALASLSPDYVYSLEDLCSFGDAEVQPESPIVDMRFRLEPEEREKLAVAAPAMSAVHEVIVTKHFDSSYGVAAVQVDPSAWSGALEEVVEEISSLADTVAELLSRESETESDRSERADQLDALQADLAGRTAELRALEERAPDGSEPPASIPDFGELLDRMTVVPGLSADTLKAIEQTREALQWQIPRVQALFESPAPPNEVARMLPPFVLVDKWDPLESRAPLGELETNPEKHRTLSNLLQLGGVTPKMLQSGTVEARDRRLKQAGRRITQKLQEVWTQEPIEVDLAVSEGSLNLYLADSQSDYGWPSRHSPGFQWYLSFYINYVLAPEETARQAVLLLDEPGVHLHPQGQRDLLRTFADLATRNQIVYSTHLSHLVDRNRPEQVRAVVKETGRGSVVYNTPYEESTTGVRRALRSAPGGALDDLLPGARKRLLVPDAGDQVGLTAVARWFAARGETLLDMNEVRIVSGQAAEQLLSVDGLAEPDLESTAILLNSDDAGRAALDRLGGDGKLPEERLVSVAQFCEGEGPHQVSDLFDAALYCEAVTRAYVSVAGSDFRVSPEMLEDTKTDAKAGGKTKRKKATAGAADPRLAVRLETYLKKKHKIDLDRLQVALALRQLIEDGEAAPDEASQDRFRRLFKHVGSLLDVSEVA